MTPLLRTALALGVLLSAVGMAGAQDLPGTAPEANPAPPPAENVITTGRPITIQHLRPQNQRGINMFESTKGPGVEFKGFRVDFVAAFAAQFQSLRHENAAAPNGVNGVNESWVKDGFIQINKSPIPLPPLETLMKYATLTIGHFEIKYGDAHFRRTDERNAMYNPFVGNLIVDASMPEVGAPKRFCATKTSSR